MNELITSVPGAPERDNAQPQEEAVNIPLADGAFHGDVRKVFGHPANTTGNELSAYGQHLSEASKVGAAPTEAVVSAPDLISEVPKG